MGRQRILFATLGFTPSTALAPLRGRQPFDLIHIFYGDNDQPESLHALEAARTTCETLGVKLEEHPIQDPFDYVAVITALIQTKQKHPSSTITVNGSAGTRPMVMAASIFAFTHNLRLVYYDERNLRREREIPLQFLREVDRLGDTQRTILRRLVEKGPCDMSTLASELGLAASTLTVHIMRLKRAASVTIERDGRRRIVAATPAVDLVDLERSVPAHA